MPEELKAIKNPVTIKKKTIGSDLLLNINCMNFDDILKSSLFFRMCKVKPIEFDQK